MTTDYLAPEAERPSSPPVRASAGIATLVGPLPPPLGGDSVHAARLVEELRRRGWQVTVLSAGRTRPAGDVTAHLGNSIVRHLFFVLRHARGTVHVHHRISPLTYCAVVASRLRRCRVVVTVHGDPIDVFTRRRGLDVFMRLGLRLAHAVITVNEVIAAKLRAHAPRVPVSVIPAYIPVAADEVEELDPDLDDWMRPGGGPILSVIVSRTLSAVTGRVDVYGLDTVTLLVERMREEGERVRLVLLLGQPAVDSHEQRYIDSMTERLREALGDDVRILLGKPALPVIARSGVFLRPTRSDGDALSVREALDLGVPVVASDVAPRPAGTLTYATGDLDDLLGKVRLALTGCRPSAAGAAASTTVDEILDVYAAAGLDASGRAR